MRTYMTLLKKKCSSILYYEDYLETALRDPTLKRPLHLKIRVTSLILRNYKYGEKMGFGIIS